MRKSVEKFTTKYLPNMGNYWLKPTNNQNFDKWCQKLLNSSIYKERTRKIKNDIE
jgi:hypothetical protein